MANDLDRAARRAAKFERGIRQLWQPPLETVEHWLDEEKTRARLQHETEMIALRERQSERHERDLASGRTIDIPREFGMSQAELFTEWAQSVRPKTDQ